MSSEALSTLPEPFGYFRATPFGWEDCAETDEGAQALYDEGAIHTQAARIAELEAEIANLHTTMMAAAVEIHEHWEAHCDAEGYGPANLMHRLEKGIASQYGYDAKTLQRVESERDQLQQEVNEQARLNGMGAERELALIAARDQLRAEVERLRKPLTDEQLLTLAAHHLGEMHVENCGLGDIKEFARAIEAAKEA